MNLALNQRVICGTVGEELWRIDPRHLRAGLLSPGPHLLKGGDLKRGTPRHPKMADFVRILDMRPRSLAPAVGYLELLWHFAAEFCPQGNIGRFSDDRIEAALDWRGPRGKLLGALSEAGWVDECPVSRLLVHDWHEHCDESVRRKLQRAGLEFLTVRGEVTDPCRNIPDSLSEEVRLPLPWPLPKPEPIPQTPNAPNGAGSQNGHSRPPRKLAPGKRSSDQISKALGDRLPWWEEFWKVYPCREGKNPAMDAFERKIQTRDVAVLAYKGAGRYADKCHADPTIKIKYAQGWINDERWTDEIIMPVPKGSQPEFNYVPPPNILTPASVALEIEAKRRKNAEIDAAEAANGKH